MSIFTPEELIQSYIAAYNRFDLDGMCALLSSTIHFEHHAGGELGAQADGLHAFRDLAETGAAMFSEREQRVTGMRFDEHGAVVDIAFKGTLAKDVAGAGTVVTLDGVSEFAFEDGCISRIVDRS